MNLEKYIKLGKCCTLSLRIKSVNEKRYFIEKVELTRFEKKDAIGYIRSKKKYSAQLLDGIIELIQSCGNEAEVYISKNDNIFFLPSDKKIEEKRQEINRPYI